VQKSGKGIFPLRSSHSIFLAETAVAYIANIIGNWGRMSRKPSLLLGFLLLLIAAVLHQTGAQQQAIGGFDQTGPGLDQTAQAWHPGGSTKHCMRRSYCIPQRIHLDKNCCFNPLCRSRPGVSQKCQLLSRGLF